MRFKLLPIFAALLLLCGCGGARTLADVSGCGQWSRVQIIEWYEQGGSAGTQLPADSLSPDTLRELLGSTAKFPRWAAAYKYPPEVKSSRCTPKAEFLSEWVW